MARDAGRYDAAVDRIDLRSDTVTQPSAGMRAAMATADVGRFVELDPTSVRTNILVTHLDVSADDCRRAADVLGEAVDTPAD